MRYMTYKEHRIHGSASAPFAFYYVSENHPRYKMILHWHDEMEIIKIVKGAFLLTVDGKNYKTKEGDIIFIMPGMLHSGIPKNCIYECLLFDLKYFYRAHTIWDKILNPFMTGERRVQLIISSEGNEISTYFNQIIKSIHEKNIAYELNISGLLYLIFYEIFNHSYYEETIAFSSLSQQRLVQFKKVIHYIELNHQAKISLDELSEIAGYDKKYFCAFFKELSGKTPIQYLNIYRIDFASELLVTTHLPVTEIAYQSGFDDLSYFSKIFKMYKSLTPLNYRNLHRIKEEVSRLPKK